MQLPPKTSSSLFLIDSSSASLKVKFCQYCSIFPQVPAFLLHQHQETISQSQNFHLPSILTLPSKTALLSFWLSPFLEGRKSPSIPWTYRSYFPCNNSHIPELAIYIPTLHCLPLSCLHLLGLHTAPSFSSPHVLWARFSCRKPPGIWHMEIKQEREQSLITDRCCCSYCSSMLRSLIRKNIAPSCSLTVERNTTEAKQAVCSWQGNIQ